MAVDCSKLEGGSHPAGSDSDWEGEIETETEAGVAVEKAGQIGMLFLVCCPPWGVVDLVQVLEVVLVLVGQFGFGFAEDYLAVQMKRFDLQVLAAVGLVVRSWV